MINYDTQYKLMYGLFEDLERDITSSKSISQEYYCTKYGVPVSNIGIITKISQGDIDSFDELVSYYENMIEDELEEGGDIEELLYTSSNYLEQLLNALPSSEVSEETTETNSTEELEEVEEFEEKVVDTSTGEERKAVESDIVIKEGADTNEVQSAIKKKIEREAKLLGSITYETMETLLEEYKKHTNTDNKGVSSELKTIMVLMDSYHDSEIVKFMLEDIEYYEDYKIIHNTLLSMVSGYDTNPVQYRQLEGVDKTTMRKLVLYSLVHIYSLLTWRIAQTAITSTELTDEEKEEGIKRLALLYKTPEDMFLTGFAKEQVNQVADNIPNLLASCKAYLDNNTTIVILRRKLKEREEKEERIKEEQAKKEEEQEMKKQAKHAFENDEVYQDRALLKILDGTVSSILSKYSQVLPNLYVKGVKGVLTPEGVLLLDKSETAVKIKLEYESSIEAKKLFHLVSDSWKHKNKSCLSHTEDNLYSFDTEQEVINPETLELNVTYIPSFFLKIANGIYITEDNTVEFCNNYSNYEPILRDMIKSYIIQILHNTKTRLQDTDISVYDLFFNIKEKIFGLFLNFIYVNEFDMDSVIDLTYIITYELFNKQVNLGDSINYIEENLESALKLVKSEGLYINKTAEGGVARVSFAVNIANYTGETLFTYKAVESQAKAGYKPSLNKILIGRKMDGSDTTLDLAKNTNIITSIMAGSRSGKGVQTLNILISAIGLGSGVAYADNKPDMAGIFWELERELGVPILSIDAEADITSTGIEEVRKVDYGSTIPYNIRGISTSMVKTIAYAKYLILMSSLSSVLAGGRKSGESPIIANGDRNTKLKLFVVDEINQTADSFTGVLNKLSDILSSLPKDKDKTDDEKATVIYVERIKKLILQDVMIAIKSVQNAKGGISGVRAIFIGQNVTLNKLFVGRNSTNSVFRYAIASASTSIIGVRHGSDADLGLNGAKSLSDPNGIEFLGVKAGTNKSNADYLEDPKVDATTGYFAIKPEGATQHTGHIYKSYLTLNANDIADVYNNGDLTEEYDPKLLNQIDDSFTYGLLGRVKDPNKVYKEELTKVINGKRVVNTHVGFKELMYKFVQDMEGSNYKEVLSDNLTSVYCMLFNLVRYAGFEHANLEEFLHDMSPESIVSVEELVNRMELERKTSRDFAKTHVYKPLTYKEVKEVVYTGIGYEQNFDGFNETTGVDENGETYAVAPQEGSVEQEPRTGALDILGGATLPEVGENYNVNYNQHQQNESSFENTLNEEDPYENNGSAENYFEDSETNNEQPNSDFWSEEQEQQDTQMHEERQQLQQPYEIENGSSTYQQTTNTQQQQNKPQPQQVEQESTIYGNQQKEPPQQSQLENNSLYGQHNDLTNTFPIELQEEDHHLLTENLSKGVVTRASAVIDASKNLLNHIKKAVGGLDAVHSFNFTPNGLIINGVRIQLGYTDEMLMKYPRDIALKLKKGDYTPLFHYNDVYTMKNMVELILEVEHFLQMQVLQSMHIEDKPTNVRRKLKNLQSFILNGVDLLESKPEEVRETIERPSLLRNSMAKLFGVGRNVTDNVLPSLPIQRVFNNKVVGSVAKGTLQAGAVWGLFNVAVPLFGFWGLIAGAFAVGNYMTKKRY